MLAIGEILLRTSLKRAWKVLRFSCSKALSLALRQSALLSYNSSPVRTVTYLVNTEGNSYGGLRFATPYISFLQ